MKYIGAGIIYTDGKQILLIKRSDKVRAYPYTWASAGGGIEEGESLNQTAERESREEIGTVKGKKIAEFTNNQFAMFIYKVDKPFEVKLNQEHTESKWVDLDSVEDYKLHPDFKEGWPDYLKAIKKNKNSFSEWILKLN
jgi:8-oxo-dGTP pyrophosphatase MutT (NUDIX family)